MASIKSGGGLTHGRGFDDSTRLLFLLSMPVCGEVRKSIMNLAQLATTSPCNPDHKDLSCARTSLDMADIQKLVSFFEERNPFPSTPALRSLSSGLMAEKGVNPDDALNVGRHITSSMVGKSVTEFKFSQKKQVQTLSSASYVSVAGEKIEIDPQLLYQRLIVAGISKGDLHSLFEFELCSYPPALFTNKLLMRPADKSELIHVLIKKVPSCVASRTTPVGAKFVVDGGGLLYKLPWPKHITYCRLAQTYADFVKSSYGDALVVFDGYHGPSTKDEIHQSRAGTEVGADLEFLPEMEMTMPKKAFMANAKNKQRLINLIGHKMTETGIEVEHSAGDADYTIAISACKRYPARPVTVVTEDTDVLVLLLHHYDADNEPLYMKMAKQNICISVLKSGLDSKLCESLLVIHSISGCDTTSRPYGIGKATAVSKSLKMFSQSDVFLTPNATTAEIEKAGESYLESLYGCPDGLNFGRAAKFNEKVVTSSQHIPAERLPPTSDAAKYHSQRVYHQVQAWLGIDLPPDDWGWVLKTVGPDTHMWKPIRMGKAAAPDDLLKLVRCNCTGFCNKNICSCKRNGLLCTLACGQCKGISCRNCQPLQANAAEQSSSNDKLQ